MHTRVPTPFFLPSLLGSLLQQHISPCCCESTLLQKTHSPFHSQHVLSSCQSLDFFFSSQHTFTSVSHHVIVLYHGVHFIFLFSYHVTSNFSLANSYSFHPDTVSLIVSPTQFAIIIIFLCLFFSVALVFLSQGYGNQTPGAEAGQHHQQPWCQQPRCRTFQSLHQWAL